MKFKCPHCGEIISSDSRTPKVTECPHCEWPVICSTYSGEAKTVEQFKKDNPSWK